MEMMILGAHERIEKIRSVVGTDLPESEILRALSLSGNDPDAAIKVVLDMPGFMPRPLTVKRTVTSTGARVSAQIKPERPDEANEAGSYDGLERKIKVKDEPEAELEKKASGEEESGETNVMAGNSVGNGSKICVKEEIRDLDQNVLSKMSFDDYLRLTNTPVMSVEESVRLMKADEAGSYDGLERKVKVKDEPEAELEKKVSGGEESGEINVMEGKSVGIGSKVCVKEEVRDLGQNELPQMSSDDHLRLTYTPVMSAEESVRLMKADDVPPAKESDEADDSNRLKPKIRIKEEPIAEIEKKSSGGGEVGETKVKEEPDVKFENNVSVREEKRDFDLKEISKMSFGDYLRLTNTPVMSVEESVRSMGTHTYKNQQKPSYAKSKMTKHEEPNTIPVEDGEFPDEPDWLLVGRSTVTGLSTCKGRKLEFNEIVDFTFSSTSDIVRFSTKRSGEIGRLPMEWTRCVIPLVKSSKVKIRARCVDMPVRLHLMKEIILYVSFYIHHSIFTEGDKSSWKLTPPSHLDSIIHPLHTLLKLLKINPYKKAEFTPEELDSRKRSLNLQNEDQDLSALPLIKRRNGGQQYPEQKKDEQVLSESALNKLVGTSDVYNLEEVEPPVSLLCELRPYQKQALHWMTETEKGIDVEEAAKTLHPCWAAYHICDKRASAIYVNIFSGEATTKLPTATQTARGGILADAMGLGKTVMTIALILARPGRGCPDQDVASEVMDGSERSNKKKDFQTRAPPNVKGGTLIICPMALLGQWKDEIETHSDPEAISVFVHYGGDRTTNPKVLSDYDVVLTTYGVLTSSYKNDAEQSIFHRVNWYRVVLDEAHTIKSSKTQCAQAAFMLCSHCRWCLTGTPLQNNLEDLYSLLCFLHVEPWCNWAWWHKLIQRPYECGDERGLRLVKAILRQLMLRRTKDTKDKEGRPILILPPAEVQIIECKQSEAEHDFYDALFKRSKVQFEQFVAQGKVLHNYANILELLLRLRQCCNHPFLVMSRGDSQKYTDLNKLARRFLETKSDPTNQSQIVPSHAYIEEVVEGIRRGENTECPICLESPDDPVLTPCAHLMCRECLLSSWRTPSGGICPICRNVLKRNELITCPSDSQFRIDVEKNWKESSKISKLMEYLERKQQSASGEKSIVFSQWTSFLDLLQIPLRKRGIGFLRFDGKLAQKQREKVLKEFSESQEKMVLLMSLKAGGVGLNLTAASNVFLMDPWWNPAVEEQAVMRIHRIGQKRNVFVGRFIVKDTVEERMQQVQARKQRMIAGALTDGEVRTARIEELKMLFR